MQTEQSSASSLRQMGVRELQFGAHPVTLAHAAIELISSTKSLNLTVPSLGHMA